MSWQEKLEKTRRVREQGESLNIYFDLVAGASDQFLDLLRRRFPFIDEEYLSFLKISDGASFDMCTLFGSGESTYPAIIGELESLQDDLEDIPGWEDVAIRNEFVPIGKNAGGDGFLLMPDRQIVLIDYIREVPGEGRPIANSFAELLDDVFMGPGYDKLFYPDELTADYKNAWTEYLQKPGLETLNITGQSSTVDWQPRSCFSERGKQGMHQ